MATSIRVVFASVALSSLAGLASAQLATLTANATADNAFQMSISADPLTQGTVFLSGASWNTTYTDSYEFFSPGTFYIHVAAQDFGDPAAFIADMTIDGDGLFANGSARLITNLTDWTVYTGGFGVGADTLVSRGPDGSSPWGDRSSIGNDALNIWAQSNPDNVYFTAVVRVVPSPGSLALLAAAGLVARRRRAANA